MRPHFTLEYCIKTVIEESLLAGLDKGLITAEYLDAIGYPYENMKEKLKQMRIF